ncbi:hypothetical protein KEM55_004841, partial [Ascosphaera atra]
MSVESQQELSTSTSTEQRDILHDIDIKLTTPERLLLKQHLLDTPDPFVHALPKVELHVHIEGTLTPETRWALSQRNGTPVRLGPESPVLRSLGEVQQAYRTIAARPGVREPGAPENPVQFFQAYYEGFTNLVTKEDYYDLAMAYFRTVAGMHVRYCEPFFDPQGHTSRGVAWETFMSGFREAQETAERELGVSVPNSDEGTALKSQWIMCILRDWPLDSAWEHYRALQSYKHMVIGIGLDSNERDHPASDFEAIFAQARADGYKITAHCDVNQKDTHAHIHEVATQLAGRGADRLDHALNAAERDELISDIKGKGIGMTICPWAYLRHQPRRFIGERYRRLFDTGIP